jgi:hypothetical protein
MSTQSSLATFTEVHTAENKKAADCENQILVVKLSVVALRVILAKRDSLACDAQDLGQLISWRQPCRPPMFECCRGPASLERLG